MTSAASSLPFDRGARYRPLFPLGHGGMAEVLLAVSSGPSGFAKLVVLKAMRKELATDFALRQLFLAEARFTARMNHANVVQVHEVIEATEPRIVIEYLEGQSLAAVQQRAPESFTLAMQLQVLAATLSGLHYTHELRDYDGTPLGIVHRDVSPQNVFVTYDGRVKVLDFGIATRTVAGERTHSGMIKGKFAYMPREQLLGEPIDRRADIHAVGAMLWHAAAGVRLWDGMEPSESMRCLIEGRVPRPSSVRPVDPLLERMTMKALAPDPRDRYATAAEFGQQLEDYLVNSQSVCSPREIGEFVGEQFALERRERSELIRTMLMDLGMAQAAREAVTCSGNTDGTSALSAVASLPARRISPRLAAGAAALLLVTGGGLYCFGSGLHDPTPHWAGVAVEPTEPVEPAEPRWVQVRISVFPMDATLSVDGETIHESPAILATPSDERQHEVVARLDGYAPIVKRLRFDRDLSLDLVLGPVATQPTATASIATGGANPDPPPKGPMRGVSSRARVSAPRTPTEGSEQATDCSPPFYFENGVKTYRPGCI